MQKVTYILDEYMGYGGYVIAKIYGDSQVETNRKMNVFKSIMGYSYVRVQDWDYLD